MGGAGAHKDKKKAQKQGDAKHKNKDLEMAETLRTENPCWKGYHPVGTKKKGGKTVPNCVPESTEISEKAVSKAQQRFMGMVHAVQKGDMKAPSKEIAKTAKGMSKKAGHDFAATKHKGLPNHVDESATTGSTSAGNMSVGVVYPNKPGKTYKNKDGTTKNALDVKGANLMTGGSLKR
jgi:hypothetical protein